MTTFEHAMLGINGAFAIGLDRRFGWQLVALAGVAAICPDWDGVFLLFSQSLRLVEGHRVWGHNLLVCALLGGVIGAVDYRWDLVTRCGRWVVRRLRLDVPPQRFETRRVFSKAGLASWMLVAAAAALSHLPADMVISGTDALPDWKVQLLWPFSHRGWVFALIPWGDPGASIVFVTGMFAMLRWRPRRQGIACVTLVLVVAYMAVRAWMRTA